MTTYERIKNIKAREAYQLAEHDEIARQIIELKESHKDFSGYSIGYHVPSGCNWGYGVELISYKGSMFEVVKVFGEVRHAAYVSIYNYMEA